MKQFKRRTSRPIAIRMLLRVLVVVGVLSLAGGSAGAQGTGPLVQWTGAWVDLESGQGGQLQFLLTENWAIEGQISNGVHTGWWSGTLFQDGLFVAAYSYPTMPFAANAVGLVTYADGNVIGGEMMFVTQDQVVFGYGVFELEATYVSPGMQNNPSTDYPFTGNGMYVFCAAASICGERGGNTLPGNWSWTSGLFDDIEANYPQVWCPLFTNGC